MLNRNSTIEQKLDKEITLFFNQPVVKARSSFTGKSLTYNYFLSDKMMIIAAIHTGITYSLFDLIVHYTPFSENDWAGFLDISTKSLHRYKVSAKNFKPLHSEKIIEMAEVTKAGLDVFGEMDQLKLWLNTPNYALGNAKPIELIKDSYGKELVISELTRIDHGIFV